MIDTRLIGFAVFVLLSTAVFLLTGLGKGIAAQHRRGKKAGTLRRRKRTALTRVAKLERSRRRLIAEAQMSKTAYWLLTGLCAIGGAIAGKLVFYHSFFTVVIGLLGALGPLLFLSFRLTKIRSQRIEKLYASMMILSNSYIVTEDFLQSVQDSLGILEYPAPFRSFLTYVSLINGNVEAGLRRMELQVNNSYFSQWVDVLVLAQGNRDMKYVAMSIVEAMNDVRQAQRESDTAMYAIWREYFTVLALIFSAPHIFKVMMRQAYTVLVSTLPGQALLTLLLATVVFSVVRAYKLNKPLLV